MLEKLASVKFTVKFPNQILNKWKQLQTIIFLSPKEMILKNFTNLNKILKPSFNNQIFKITISRSKIWSTRIINGPIMCKWSQ